jgi:hypothetical protein
VVGIGINPEDMLERNGDTKDRYRSADCRFKSATPMCVRTLADRVGKPSFSMVFMRKIGEGDQDGGNRRSRKPDVWVVEAQRHLL